MPPYKPVVSKAQSRELFHLASVGKLSVDEAKGKTKAANFKGLPQYAHGHPGVRALGHVGKKKRDADADYDQKRDSDKDQD
jgi:hypothetical protein